MKDLTNYRNDALYLEVMNTEEVYKKVMHHHLYGFVFDVIEYLRTQFTYRKKQFEFLMLELQALVKEMEKEDSQFYVQFK